MSLGPRHRLVWVPAVQAPRAELRGRDSTWLTPSGSNRSQRTRGWLRARSLVTLLSDNVASLGRRLGPECAGISLGDWHPCAKRACRPRSRRASPRDHRTEARARALHSSSSPASRIRRRVASASAAGCGPDGGGSRCAPELTGRENIWLYGQILGMTKVDIRRRFDEIVEFSGARCDRYAGEVLRAARLGFRSLHTLNPTSLSSTRHSRLGDAGFQGKWNG